MNDPPDIRTEDASVARARLRLRPRPMGLAEPLRILRVAEGRRSPPTAGQVAQRLFSVTLSRPPADEEVCQVAAAVDPRTGLAVPAAGEPHPDDPLRAAAAPELHAVGLFDTRRKELIATRSGFYNIRVRYWPRSQP